MKTIEYIGLKFGKLTAVSVGESDARGNGRMVCKCDCGNEALVRAASLRRGEIVSCGCHRIAMSRGRKTHGMFHHDLYPTWANMKSRCFRLDDKDYDKYGGRGITVCERWLDFKSFTEDMGERPVGTTLDRKDNDGNYEPGNCKWSTKKEQANNRRTSTAVEFEGEVFTITNLARHTGVEYCKLYHLIQNKHLSATNAVKQLRA